MPSVTYNGQSFAINGRRFWLLGAQVDYARLPADAWPARIAAAKEAGFNTIATTCPWLVHEPRRDRFEFDGDRDIKRFVRLCADHGMRVLLRPGPFIGHGYDGGGLPAWLHEIPGIVVREGSEAFLERVINYFRRLFAEVDDLQATRGGQSGGPILAIQNEHAWHCSNPGEAARYLREITRIIRESGMTVPIINANDLWQDSPGTIDTWRGNRDLLEHLRQLRTVQPNAPRILSSFEVARPILWGESPQPKPDHPSAVMYHLAESLAAGAQPIVSPFAGGMNFGFLAGRLPGGPDQFIATQGAIGAPINEAGARGAVFNAIKRIVTFARSFGHVFADLETDYHPVAQEIPEFDPSTATARGRRVAAQAKTSVVHLRGGQGRVVFVFRNRADAGSARTNLLLENGTLMPIDLGDQPVGWYIFDADLNGSGRLDYTNLCPYVVVDRSVIVLHGPEKSEAYLSINGTPVRANVPRGEKPLVIEQKGVTIVICSTRQIDATYHDRKHVYVGVRGLDASGNPLPSADFKRAWTITRSGIAVLSFEESAAAPAASGGRRKRKNPIALKDWQCASARPYAEGTSPRFATLSGPCSLTSCGAPNGYGWYRITFRVSAGRKRRYHWPEASDRVHMYLDGAGPTVFGPGRGAEPGPFDLSLTKGEHTLVALVDNFGRFADGNDLNERKGLCGHLYEIKQLRAGKPKIDRHRPVDPFVLRGYIAHLAKGALSDNQQAEWTFTHAKKSPILIDVDGVRASGTFVLNDQPVAYYSGETGACRARIMIGQEINESFKRGKNVLRFAPDSREPSGAAAKEMADAAMLYECAEALTEKGSWAFAKWEPPGESAYATYTRSGARDLRGAPCWWRARFTVPPHLTLPLWFDTTGLSKGQVFVNGRNLGRYFTALPTGHAVGPQTRLHVPAPWLKAEATNELLIFDEHGFDPFRSRLVPGTSSGLD